MKKSIYTTIFIFTSCLLFLFFVIGLFMNPDGPQRLIFSYGLRDFFADFYNVLHFIADRDPYFKTPGGAITYFPLTYLILYPFSQLDNYNTMSLLEAWYSKMGLISVFLFTVFSAFLLLAALNQIAKKYLVSSLLLISLVLSYIFLFSIERGNMVVLSAACIGFFICYYDSEDKFKRILALISLAVAATLKIYPVLFGFLYFEKKQYREILLSAVITLALVFLPFLFLKRGFTNIPQLIRNMDSSLGYNLPLDQRLPSGSDSTLDPNLPLVQSLPPEQILPSEQSLPSVSGSPSDNNLLSSQSLPKIITFFYPNRDDFVWSYPRFRVAHLIYFILGQFKFSENIEYNEIIKLSLSNIAQIITYFVCFVSIVFSCLIKNKWLKISLLTMAFVFLPADSGLYCGLYIFPMIIVFFGTLQERSAMFNVFSVIVFLVFLNPYQILPNITLVSSLKSLYFVNLPKSYNYILINIALITLWFILLVHSGRKVVNGIIDRK